MTDGHNQNGWNEYSKLVLKELETLAKSIESLREELQGMKQELTKVQVREDKIDELKEWKSRIDEVVSPGQLENIANDIDDLKLFKTKAVTIFAVIQFLMAAAIAMSKVF